MSPGDARCQPGEFSHLASVQADFGAYSKRGASFAVPQVVAEIARYLALGYSPDQALQYLQYNARYHGPERRS